MTKVNVSVRSIVEFMLRSGSIEAGVFSMSAMQDGATLHKRIQRARKLWAEQSGFEFKAEAPFSHTLVFDEIELTITGRADCLIQTPNGYIIEEIKTARDMDKAADLDNPVHIAQALCYAYMLTERENLETVAVNLVYSNLDTENEVVKPMEYTRAGLTLFFDELTTGYIEWVKFDVSRKQNRDSTTLAASFPYSGYRKGQKAFVITAYRAFESSKNLFLQAPTGIGKTMSALFPSVKAQAHGLCDKIFYITAKTITRGVAFGAVSAMRNEGYGLNAVTLTAKEKLCLAQGRCNPRDCAFADGHYDRINEALWAILHERDNINRADIIEFANLHRVCPHEFQLDITLFTDIIIGDYNHIFDPNASLKRFFGEGHPAHAHIFLIDEAHNLPDRAREMYSAELRKADYLFFRQRKNTNNAELSKHAGKVYRLIQELTKRYKIEDEPRAVSGDFIVDMANAVEAFSEKAGEQLKRGITDWPQATADRFLEIYFRAQDFLRAASIFGREYAAIISGGVGGGVRLYCLDPAAQIAERLEFARSALFFSATLSPLDYYRRVLGGGISAELASLPSPFPSENMLTLVDRNIRTTYKHRETSYRGIALNLVSMTRARRGNYFAFFSSYEYLKRVYEIFVTEAPEVRTTVQRPGLTDSEKEDFLAQFSDSNTEAFLAFAVMGGIFGEGIDLPGLKLIGVAVVGVGLPQICLERDLLSRYYENADGAGFAYAYVYPGMNKVLQAAGRLIRTETDRGVVLLMDTRYGLHEYRKLLPAHYNVTEDIDTLKDFWQ